MIYIENKLEMFENVVYKNRVTEYERKKAQWDEEKERIQKDKAAALARETEDMVARRSKLARELGNEDIAKAKERRRVLELQVMDELQEDLIEAVRERVSKWTATENYHAKLIDGIKVTIDHLKPGTYYMGLTGRDMEAYFDEIQTLGRAKQLHFIPVVEEDSIIGGHIVTDEAKTYNLNNDLYTLIEETRYDIGMLLHKLFKKERGND
ncbi:hypothetical protein O6R05_07110 [Peptoniphilus equinus]|uniref:H+-ATPase subunit E/Vma4 n=1 Tax=Peptoniphilus equinus TaxID=3016343 RepID=A0ABY7QUR0_9FIRM|nr:hypothetical protein [Peptoniphilus equinus]WBW49765.1 hypothetical protein O6R05_07110 [Peptoniphilus equinus]